MMLYSLRRLMPAATIVCLLFALPVSAAWEQKDLGTVQSLRGIAQSGDAYIAAGNSGNIVRSADGGLTWSVVDNNASVFWQDVDANAQTVRVIGEGGTMRESTDNGIAWSNTVLSVTENLYDLDMDGDYGFLVGSTGRIMNMHPSAKLWQSVTSPTTLDLRRVQLMADRSAWVVGQQGVLLYTPDYGINWTNKGSVVNQDLYGLWFTSATQGYVVGKNGTFRKTTDSGTSWSDISVSGLTSQSLYDIRASGDKMIIVGDKIILTSDDAGATWASTTYVAENFTFHNSYFDAAGNMWAVGTKDDVKSVVFKFEPEPAPDAGLENPNPPEEPVGAEPPETSPNSLVKIVCSTSAQVNDPCKAVYFYGTDGKRHAFPNEKVFFTWYTNFDNVVTVSADFMSTLPLGKNVTYHPGTRMVKFQSVPTVYAVEKGGVLRAISTEQVAMDLYGSDWNKQIDDISDSFFGNYTFGEKIHKATDYSVVSAKTSVLGLDDNF